MVFINLQFAFTGKTENQNTLKILKRKGISVYVYLVVTQSKTYGLLLIMLLHWNGDSHKIIHIFTFLLCILHGLAV